MNNIKTHLENYLSYSGITITIKRADPGFPTLGFLGEKYQITGLKQMLGEQSGLISITPSGKTLIIDPNKLSIDVALNELYKLRDKIKSFGMRAAGVERTKTEEPPKALEGGSRAAKPALLEGEPKPSAAAKAGKPSFSLGNFFKGIVDKIAPPSAQSSEIGLFKEKKDIRPEENTITLYRKDGMLAVEFPSKATRDKFIAEMGSHSLNPYQKSICKQAIEYSDQCPVIKNFSDAEEEQRIFYIPAAEFNIRGSQPPKKQLAAAFVTPVQSDKFLDLLGLRHSQTTTVVPDPRHPTLYFQDEKILASGLDAKIKIRSETLFKFLRRETAEKGM